MSSTSPDSIAFARFACGFVRVASKRERKTEERERREKREETDTQRETDEERTGTERERERERGLRAITARIAVTTAGASRSFGRPQLETVERGPPRARPAPFVGMIWPSIGIQRLNDDQSMITFFNQ